MAKKVTTQENAATVTGPFNGGVITTAASVVATDVSSLIGSYVTLQAFTADLDFYMEDVLVAPAAAPVITATALGTARVGRRVVVGIDKDFFIPEGKSGKMWLVHQATGAGTIRILPS